MLVVPLEKLTRAVRRVTTEQRKLTHSLTQQAPTDTLRQRVEERVHCTFIRPAGNITICRPAEIAFR